MVQFSRFSNTLYLSGRQFLCFASIEDDWDKKTLNNIISKHDISLICEIDENLILTADVKGEINLYDANK